MNYRIEIESVYDKDYQNNQYRAVIFNENNEFVIRGSNKFSYEEEALEEGKFLIERLKRKDLGLSFSNKKWLNADIILRTGKSLKKISQRTIKKYWFAYMV